MSLVSKYSFGNDLPPKVVVNRQPGNGHAKKKFIYQNDVRIITVSYIIANPCGLHCVGNNGGMSWAFIGGLKFTSLSLPVCAKF